MATSTIDSLVSLDTIRTAAARISGIALQTPLVRAPFPGVAGQIWLKAESLQPIGSFKLRGAANRILQLTPEEIARGVIIEPGVLTRGPTSALHVSGQKQVLAMLAALQCLTLVPCCRRLPTPVI